MYPVLLCWTPDLPHPGHQQLRSLSGFCLSSVVVCSPRATTHTGLVYPQLSSVVGVLLHPQSMFVLSCLLFSACYSTHRPCLSSVVFCSPRATPHTQATINSLRPVQPQSLLVSARKVLTRGLLVRPQHSPQLLLFQMLLLLLLLLPLLQNSAP